MHDYNPIKELFDSQFNLALVSFLTLIPTRILSILSLKYSCQNKHKTPNLTGPAMNAMHVSTYIFTY